MNATQALASLQPQFSGRIVLPDDAGYDDVRTVFNAMIDRYPAAIAYAQSTDDASRAVRWAAAQGSLLAVPSGIIGSTGVGGLTRGGGIGHLSRKCGLTIDNLLEAEVVLADGRVVRASANSEPDLFWALRGGGGNFGVVTQSSFRAHPVATVIARPMFWPLSQAAEVMRWYRGFIATAPEELNGFLALLKVPPVEPYPLALHGQAVCGVVWCHVGTAEQAALDLAPARAAVPPMVDGVQPMPFTMLHGAFDGLYTPGLQWYWRADFVQQLGDAALS